MTDDRLGTLFFALADPLRRRVLEEVGRRSDATVTEICAAFEVSRFAIMRHLNVLEEAGFIVRTPVGRERRVRLADLPFGAIIAAWADKVKEGEA